MKTRHYLITGVLAYFFLLFYSVPAAPLYELFKDELPGVHISTIDGSLWQGTADNVDTSQLSLQRVSWSFIGWRLLLAEAAFSIDARLDDRPVTADIGVGIGGAIHVHNLDAVLDAATIAKKYVVLPIGELAGNVNVAIESATWSKASVPEINGVIDWKKASIKVAETAQLGEVNIRLFEADESPLSADISNSNGQLSINGNLSTQADGIYTLQLKLKPGQGASRNLVSSLAMIARKQPDGSFVINNSGTLSQLGLM